MEISAKRLRRLILIPAAILVSGIVGSLYSARRTRNLAEQFLHAAKSLELGKASLDDVLAVANASRGTQEGFGSCTPHAEHCTGRVYFENRWLHRWHLAAPTYFACRFGIKANKLNDRWCELVSYRNAGRTDVDWGAFVIEKPSLHLFEGEREPGTRDKSFRLAGLPSSEMLGVIVTPQTPDNIRTLAYEFDLRCLSNIGGCRTREEMLPILNRKNL